MNNRKNPGFDGPYQHKRIRKDIHIPRNSHKLDKTLYGFILGLIVPMLGMLIVWLLVFSHYDFDALLKLFVSFNFSLGLKEAAKIISLGMILNLAPFYLLLNKQFYTAVKGVIMATFIYLIIVAVYLLVF